MTVLRYGRRTGALHLGADHVSVGIVTLFGDRFKLGAGFGPAPVLVGGDRLDERLLQFPQVLERPCFDVEISNACLLSRMTDPGSQSSQRNTTHIDQGRVAGQGAG